MNRILISNYNYSNINIDDIMKRYERTYYRIIYLILTHEIYPIGIFVYTVYLFHTIKM